MKKTFMLLTVFSMLLVLFGCDKTPKIDTSTWTTNFEAAKIAAEKENKEIILLIGQGTEKSSDFKNKDYPDFKENIMYSEDFLSKMTEKYVLVNYDFNDTLYEKVLTGENPEGEKELLDAMIYFTMYSFVNLPAVAVLTSEGFVEKEFYLEPSCPKNADEFLALIDSYSEEINYVKSMLEETKTGTMEEKINAIDSFCDVMEDQGFGLTTSPLSRKLVALDKNNKSGLVSKHLFSIVQTDFTFAILRDDVALAEKACASIQKNKFLTLDERQILYYNYAKVLYTILVKHDENAANEALVSNFQRAYDVSPNSVNAEYIQGELYQIMLMLQSAVEQEEIDAQESEQSGGNE